METLANGFTLEIKQGCFPLSTDSMVLAHFARLPRNARVLDLGSGCGTLGLLLCAKDSSCHVTGLELDEKAHLCALENIAHNGISHRMESHWADLRTHNLHAGSFDCCISNPPYFQGGPSSQSLPQARREDSCTAEDLFQAAAGALKYGGDFFLVHRPERLAELILWGNKFGLEAKKLGLLRHREGASVSLVLLQLRKGARPGLIWEDLILHDKNGDPTELYRSIYHV